MKIACIKPMDDEEWERFSCIMNDNGYKWRSGASLLGSTKFFPNANFYYVNQDTNKGKYITYSRGMYPCEDDNGVVMDAITLEEFLQAHKELIDISNVELSKELLNFLDTFSIC